MQFAEFFHYLVQYLIISNKFDEFLYVMSMLKGIDSLFTFDNIIHVLPKYIGAKFVGKIKK